jgi:tRNA-splicing endonuclease subunit Sen2
MGFFGKGSLSRSEPEWLDQEGKKRGISKKDTSTDVTRKRRDERKGFKLERARQEREAIKQKLKEEALSASKEEDQRANEVPEQNGHANGHLAQSEVHSSPSPSDIKDSRESDSSLPLKILVNGDGHINHKISASTSSSENDHTVGTRDDVSTRSSSSSKTVRFSPTVERVEFEIPTPIDASNGGPKPPNNPMHPPILNQEHLQLTYEEAFFLSYGLGALQVYDSDLTSPLSPSTLLQRFLRTHPVSSLSPSISQSPEPDDPFLLSYAVYHHFRSLGWVVRSGAKFSVDYLLYDRGPVFSHALFAVIVLPSYSHSYWATEPGRQKSAKNETKSWSWLHCVNRVQTAVQKNLVLCYVEVPPPVTVEEAEGEIGGVEVGKELDIGEFFKRYKVREINIQRWSANRMK